MPSRRALASGAGLALLATLVTSPTPALGREAAPPTNAAAIFKWGTAAWGDEFHSVEPLPAWTVNKPERVLNEHGMMTLESKPGGRGGTVVALAADQAAREGRWEARVRARRYSFTGTPYQAIWELVPVNKYKCGGKNIVLSAYAPDDLSVTGAVRTLPDREFSFSREMDLGKDVFHTYAIEVTDDHISWFVDTAVVHTERRPEALSNVMYQPRFRLQAPVLESGATMDHTRMQMDWARYYTLARRNQQSIEAPEMSLGTYAGVCPTAVPPVEPAPARLLSRAATRVSRACASMF